MTTVVKGLYRIVVMIVVLVICGNCAQKLPTKQELQHSLTQRAEQGDVHAQFELGKFYYFLEEDPTRHEKAFPWFLKAAEKGNMYAMHYLGRMYHYGYFVKKDEAKAKEYFSKSIATLQNDSLTKNPEAWYCLGWSYHYGIEVEKNDTEAVKWFEKAAKKGHVIALYDLGLCYIKGEGVEKDQEQAEKWMLKAAERYDAMAQFVYASKMFWFKNNTHSIDSIGIQISVLLTNDSEMQLWIYKAAYQGLSYAEYLIGVLNQLQLPQNDEEAFRWKKLAAEKGHYLAQFEIGDFYYELWNKNKTNTENYEKSFYFIEKSALQGFYWAEGKLGILYREGPRKDNYKSLYWLKKGAKKGDPFALYTLGKMYYFGNGVKQDKSLGYAMITMFSRIVSNDYIIGEYSRKMTSEEMRKSGTIKEEIRKSIDNSVPNQIIHQSYGLLNVQSVLVR